jgi:hypothetical protein
MFTRIIQLLQKNKAKKIVFLTICIGLMSAYPIYRNFYYGRAMLQYERHVQFMNVQSRFHNPWQYRILTPLMVEGLKIIYDNTVDKIYPIGERLKINLPEGADPRESTKELLSLANNPDFIKYTLIYAGLRFIQNVAIFVLCYILFAYFVKSDWLIFLALMVVSLAMGNSVNDSDFTLHTYLDNILYLLAAIVIVYKKNPWYILLLTLVGALNRETALLIPFLYAISVFDWTAWRASQFSLAKIPFPSVKTITIVLCSLTLFIGIFIFIRWYYGYQPQTQWKVPAGWPMLKLNLISLIAIKSYFEMIGAFSIIPLLCLYKFKSTNPLLQIWFIGIVPIWFLVHFVSVVAYQSRLFLVPTFLIFIPMMLEIIEQEYLRLLEKNQVLKIDEQIKA